MKYLLAIICGMLLMGSLKAFQEPEPYVLQNAGSIAVKQPGPHGGGGETIASPFFEKVKDMGWVFRQRTLKPGSAIGYHYQKEDEIYYVLEGKGMMLMNGDSFLVKKGDAILTRPGSSHGIHPLKDDLTILISYMK